MRRFVSGVVWGAVVSGVGVAAVSLIAPLAPSPDLSGSLRQSGLTAPEPVSESGVAAGTPDADLVAEIRRGLAALKRGKAKLYTLEELFTD